MKIIKFLFKLIVILVLIIATAIGGIVLFVDPNDYKPEIVEIVNEKTGRELVIPGDISFSVYPWLGLKLGKASLSNPSTFARPHFAQINSFDIRISLKKLLQLRPEIGILHLDGLEVTLIKRSDGISNWDDFIEENENNKANKELVTEDKERSDLDSVIKSIGIGSIEITNANMYWLDETSNTNLAFEDLNIRTSAFKLSIPMQYDLSFATDLKKPAVKANVISSGKLSIRKDLTGLTLNSWNLSADIEGETIPGQKQNVQLSGNIIYDFAEQLANFIDIKIQMADATLVADIKVSELADAPKAKGKLIMLPFSLAETMKNLAIDLPEMADPNALQKVDFISDIETNEKDVNLGNIRVNIDESFVEGDAKITLSEKINVNYKFILDEINLDNYLEPADEEELVNSEIKDQALDLPIDLIKQLNVNGELKAKSMQLMNLHMREIEVQNIVRNDIAQVQLKANKLYSGKGEMLASIDAREDVPAVSAEVQLFKVQLDPLLKDYLGESFAAGKGDVSFSIRSKAETSQQLLSTMNGVLDYQLVDGEIIGINIAEKLRRVEALRDGVKYKKSREVNSADFASSTGKASIKNGKLRWKNLEVEAPLLRATATGSVDLYNELFNTQFTAYFVNTKTGQAGKNLNDVRSLKVPIKLAGSFDEPKFDVLGSFLNAYKKNVKDNITNNFDKTKAAEQEKIKLDAAAKQAEIDAQRAKIEEKKQEEKLRLEAEKQKAKDEAKEKLLNKFR